MKSVSKRSGGKLRPGDYVQLSRTICVEVVSCEPLNDDESKLLVRIRPGQQAAFVDPEKRLVIASDIDATLRVKNNKRFEHRGNIKEIEAEYRHNRELLKQLNDSQSASAIQKRSGVTHSSPASRSAESNN